ncbi:MAG: DUF2062 domain-containing protein [Chromatocurvus sp.]
MPKASELRSSGALRPFGEWIYASNYWHLNRYSASMAFFVGLFVAFLPLPGQMLIAALLAIPLRCNLPLSVALVWVSNPLTAPPLFYLAYRLGGLLIEHPAPIPAGGSATAFDLYWLFAKIGTVWPPLLLGCLLLGLFAGSVGYFVINTIWRWRVGRDWRRRQRRRLATTPAATRRPAPGARPGVRDTAPPADTAAAPPATPAQNPAAADPRE